MWYCSVYNQTASDAWRYNNPVYKLMTDKLQLMLINVLLDQFLNNKVSQGNVATHLSCDGILNDQFITQSLLSPRLKKFWKSVNICQSYGQLSTGLFFYETRCILGWCTCLQVYLTSPSMSITLTLNFTHLPVLLCCIPVNSTSPRLRVSWQLVPSHHVGWI